MVKRFSYGKGYGFLSRDDGGPDVFVHYSAVQTETYKGLKKGAIVRFSVVQGPRGPCAEWVLALGRPLSARSQGASANQDAVSQVTRKRTNGESAVKRGY
jgi:CspA family cold shock protein